MIRTYKNSLHVSIVLPQFIQLTTNLFAESTVHMQYNEGTS